VLLCVALSLMPTLLTVGDESAMNIWGDFAEFYVCELSRTPLLRSSVCPITPTLWGSLIWAGIISVLCIPGYEPSILYIRKLAV
jgi:hypothetical protein